LAVLAGSLLAGCAVAPDVVIRMNLVDDKRVGREIGTVTASDTAQGLRLTPNLGGLTPGAHGFHVHTNPDCGAGIKDGKVVPGLAAGGHFDPEKTDKHEGPKGKGHLGDLPVLMADASGDAKTPVVAPRLKLADLLGRSLMIHAEGDNYSDAPKPLGGGGARVACGVIE
jgi:Cu-Zn family superoxide dismutase